MALFGVRKAELYLLLSAIGLWLLCYFAGLTNFNMAYILESAIIVGLLAIFIDYLLKNIERNLTYLV
ncbi:MAG: hypothetical protein ACK5LE_01750 [Alphaproteobacteria bacterium]